MKSLAERTELVSFKFKHFLVYNLIKKQAQMYLMYMFKKHHG